MMCLFIYLIFFLNVLRLPIVTESLHIIAANVALIIVMAIAITTTVTNAMMLLMVLILINLHIKSPS